LVALLFSLLTLIADAKGQEYPAEAKPYEASRGRCSQATLKGTYGYLEEGTIVVPFDGLPLTPPFPTVTSGIAVYDGKGHSSGTWAASLGGVIMTGTYTGTYTVSPDCTYSDELTILPGLAIHDAGTITGEEISQEVHYIRTDAGRVIVGTTRKTSLGPCSLASLRGSYALFGQGTYTGFPVPTPVFPPPPLLWAHSGIVTFDGKGDFSFSENVSLNGFTGSDSGTGTYSVHRDCSLSFVVNTPELVVHESGTITGEGEFQEVHTVVTDEGWAAVDGLKKQ
jgi:hypothetical protein